MKSKDNKSERVIVHLRMRPFNDDELKRDQTQFIETFDTENNIAVGKYYLKILYVYVYIFISLLLTYLPYLTYS